MRGLSRAVAQWSSVSTVVQRGVTRRSKAGVVLGFESAAKDGDRDAGGAWGCQIKPSRGSCRAGPALGLIEGFGRPVRGEEKGEER
jgi:hypothetical protein